MCLFSCELKLKCFTCVHVLVMRLVQYLQWPCDLRCKYDENSETYKGLGVVSIGGKTDNVKHVYLLINDKLTCLYIIR